MSKRKLLLADDSITIQKVVNLTFADEGVEVITVGDGDAAVEKIAEVSPDLVLADVHMPGLNGYQICEWIRGNPGMKELPVILLVGSFEPFDETEAARVGANAYLTKPFQSIRQLVTQVTDLMEPAQSVQEANGHHQAEAETGFESAGFGETESAPIPAVADTNDIDSLYHQSFGEPVSEEKETHSPHFVDAGMDDEMIETTFSSGAADANADSVYGDMAYNEEPVSDFSDQAAGVEDIAPRYDSVYDTRQQSVSEFHYDEPTLSGLTPTSEYTSESENIALGSEDPDRPNDETDHHSYVDQFAKTEQIPPVIAHEETESFQLDDAELLELPPLDNEKTIEFKTPDELVDEEARKQVVTLSPELMETIVAKVVEKLSKDN